jgi:2,5-diketo-D-gluconate reductase A
MVGFGTYLVKDAKSTALVEDALAVGYRHIDTAECYGNEVGVGIGIKNGLAANNLKREDLFITTKLWQGNSEWGQAPKTYEATLTSMDESLQKLQLDFVDLYLIHAPLANSEERLQQWRALVELRKRGKAKAIGVSNWDEAHIDEIKAADLPLPDANQIELHPWSQKPGLVGYLNDNSITPIAYSSLVPLSTWRTGQQSAKTDAMRADGEDSAFQTMALKYGVSEAQVLLRWGLQSGYPILPKSSSRKRMEQNIDLFAFKIDDEDMATIRGMDRGGGVAWSAGVLTM